MTWRPTRRELAAATVAGLAAVRHGGAERGELAGRVGLGTVRDAEDGSLSRGAAEAAVAAALVAASGAESALAAARALFHPDDVVGIKLSCLAGPRLSPRVGLVEALVELIAAAGVARSRILVFERSSRELARAGFDQRTAADRYRVVGTDGGWDRQPTVSGEIGSCFARQVSTDCTALVSFGVVKDHDLAGVSAGLKNWYGVIHNPNKYHDNGCDPYLVDVVSHPLVRGKLRLTVLDAVRAQCHGGPAFNAAYGFAPGLVAAATDPVAVDAWAWGLIEAERARRELPSLTAAERPPRFLATAERRGLGVATPVAVPGGAA